MPADNAAEGRAGHSLLDHQYGWEADHAHEHGDDADHEHDDPDNDYLAEGDTLALRDQVSMISVGIDIGSSGTQLIFARLELARDRQSQSSRYALASHTTLYQSPIAFTPFQSATLIDETALRAIIDQAYGDAGLHPDAIETGVVILTGQALQRENAKRISAVVAEESGDLVCASAGHHMEAALAAYGSGAAQASLDSGKRILNVDIGGGTTKLAVLEGGKVIASAALRIGGRLQVVDADGTIVRMDDGGRYAAQQAGVSATLHQRAAPQSRGAIAEWMAGALIAALTTAPLAAGFSALYLTEPLPACAPFDGVMFSGGVAEYIYGREERDFDDLGRLLGLALRRALEQLPFPLLPAGECIRATALGASEYAVQLSGNTSYISSPGKLLPRRNLQVLRPDYDCTGAIDADQLATAIRRHLRQFDRAEGDEEVALAFHWDGLPSYERIAAFASGIEQAMAPTIARALPLFLIVDGDLGHTLGRLLREEMGVASEVLVLDGIELRDFDFIDLGRLRLPSQTVPVSIKSLVFRRDPRLVGTDLQYRRHLHRHGDGHSHQHHHGPGATHHHHSHKKNQGRIA